MKTNIECKNWNGYLIGWGEIWVGGSQKGDRRVLPLTGLLLLMLFLPGCYSFRGGSAPAHLKTVLIPQAEDNSGFGRSTIRFDLTNELIDRFRSDNSLRVIDDSEANSRLDVTITTVRNDIRLAVSSVDRETVRGVVIEARATFYDNVRSRAIFEGRLFKGESSYDISEGQSGEDAAVAEAIDNLSNEILLATVADW
ncbi:MAG: LPS assembly lipoprotein LptE [Candidatus Kapaibacterium sp.]